MCNQFEGQTTVVLDQQTVRALLLCDLMDVFFFLMLLKLAEPVVLNWLIYPNTLIGMPVTV